MNRGMNQDLGHSRSFYEGNKFCKFAMSKIGALGKDLSVLFGFRQKRCVSMIFRNQR